MAARYDLSTPGTPLLHKQKLEIPPKTPCRVQVKDGGYTYFGLCLQNPAATNRPDVLVLQRVKGRDLDDPRGIEFTFDSREFKCSDIAELQLLDTIHTVPEKDERPESLMITKVVSTFEDVQGIIEAIHNMNLKTVVVAGLIEGSGRFGKLGWLCFVVRRLLVCIDTIALEKSEKFWTVLEKKIFRNEEIIKVCHNGRKLLDNLFHQHGIKIHNLFDTQVAEMFIRCHQNREKMPAKVEDISEGSPFNWEYYPVSRIYQKFVPHLVLPEEMKYLEEYEGTKFKINSPFIQRPVPLDCPHYKTAAIQMKYLEQVQEAQMKILLSHFTLCMREQIKVLYRGNNTATMERFYIPHNVMEMMKSGMPLLSSDRGQDFAF